MESEADTFLVIPRQDELLRDVPSLHEDILRHIATFLDFQSIRHFRLVCREWNAAGTGILMKRGYYDLTHTCHGNEERRDLLEGAKHYSSWKISHSVYKSSKILHDNGMWGNVRSLSIHTCLPLTREFHCWAWETIMESRCPNLQELTISFESASSVPPHHPEVVSDYKQAITTGTSNPSFPQISSLKNLVSVHFKGICDGITAYFAQHLLQTGTPSLRHLFFCPITEPRDYTNLKVGEAYRIFEYLKQNPALIRNLHSFAIHIGLYSSNGIVDELDLFSVYRNRSEFAEFLKRNSCLRFQFSENLRSLFWDSPFHLDDQLLPGVLTPCVASSLVQLSLKFRVKSFEEGAYNDAWQSPIKISFPNFPRLRVLKLGVFAARSLSVPELIDSAPNLHVLDMTGLRNMWEVFENDMSTFWRGSEEGSVASPKQHSQLRVFCTDIRFHSLSTLQMISSKFPNLVVLRLGTVWNVRLRSFINFVQSKHPQLQGLSWTFEEMVIGSELFRHLVRVPELLPNLKSYSVGNDHTGWPIRIQSLKVSTKILPNLLRSNSKEYNSNLIIHLRIKPSTCHYNCKPEKEYLQIVNCKHCYLRQFIRTNQLPIRIHSEREIEDKSWFR
jgi:hypothetical protein